MQATRVMFPSSTNTNTNISSSALGGNAVASSASNIEEGAADDNASG